MEKASGIDCLADWLTEDVLIANDAQYTWARYRDADKRLVQQAKSMPGEHFRLVDDRLIRDGQRIATAQLPDLQWQPIASAIPIQLPWISEAGQVANLKPLTWQLVRGGAECSVAGIMVDWQVLLQWTHTAPQWRLSELLYCVSEWNGQRQALVLGTPVPTVDAQFLIAKENILLPAGMQWLPALDASCVKRSFDVQPGRWLLWRATDDWSVIDSRLFVPLSRVSVRLFEIEGTQPS